MVENFGGTLNLILFLINLLGISYYGFLTVFSPNTIVTRYDLGEKALPIVRIIGTFILPIVIIGIWILFCSFCSFCLFCISVCVVGFVVLVVPVSVCSSLWR